MKEMRFLASFVLAAACSAGTLLFPVPARAQSLPQGLTPLPSDLSRLPMLGIDKTAALKILDQNMRFTGSKGANGLETLSATPDGKTTVVFTCVGDQVVAASVTIPLMGAQPAEQDAVKVPVLLRVLTSLIPGEDWGPYPLGQIVNELKARPEVERWLTTIGEIQVTPARARPEFLVIRVVNQRIEKERYNLGDF